MDDKKELDVLIEEFLKPFKKETEANESGKIPDFTDSVYDWSKLLSGVSYSGHAITGYYSTGGPSSFNLKKVQEEADKLKNTKINEAQPVLPEHVSLTDF